jgi:AbrB family looped-hinge helix DNA binding protein
MSEESVVGRRHTVVIPKAVRDRLALKEGQRVMVRAEGGKIVIEPLPCDPLKVLEQVLGAPYKEGVEERRAEEWVKRHAGR